MHLGLNNTVVWMACTYFLLTCSKSTLLLQLQFLMTTPHNAYGLLKLVGA